MRKALWLLVCGTALVTGLMTYVFVTGPNMSQQPGIRTFHAALPPLSTNSVPLPAAVALPGALSDSVADTPENRRRGRIYYEYYCVQCHGPAADGNGPVGASYTPAPADLRTAVPRIAADGELVRRMLTGIGHAPVLARVVRPAARGPLVLYLRHLDAEPAPQKP